MEIENQFHFEIELLRTLDVEIEPEADVILDLLQKAQDLDYKSALRNINLISYTRSNNSGESALHIAARRNFLNSAWILLEAGASVNVTSLLKHQTPLHLCSGLENGVEMVRLLLRHGADANAKDGEKRTPLHVASNSLYVDIIQELVNSGADVNAVSEDDRTPLIGAFMFASFECDRFKEKHTTKIFLITEALLRAGADVNYNSKNGGTALHCAALRNRPHVIRLLLKNKAEVNAKTRDGKTPLHRAMPCSHQPVETIRELVQGGALVDALDFYERSALYYALNECNIEAAQELLRNGAHFKFVYFINALEALEKRVFYQTVFCKELIRYVYVNSPDSLESVLKKLEDDDIVNLLRKHSTPNSNLVDFKDACATEADALSKRSCDCGQSNIWATFLGHQECGCDRSHAILKFLFSGQHSNFDYCFFYKLSKNFLLEIMLNHMSFSEFKEFGNRVVLDRPCVKDLERYVSFEDVAAFIQSQRSVMGASGLEEVLTFAKEKSPTESSSETKPPCPKKLRVS